MKQRMFVAALGAGAIGLSACAHTVPVEGTGTPATSVAASGSGRWSANIQSVVQSRGDVAQSTRDRSYGSATWGRGDAAALSKVDLVFTYSGQEKFLAWAILPGGCGVAAIPILSTANFPEINVGGGGRGQVTTSLPIDLPEGGNYHINIYRDRRQGVDALVACGNLKYSRG